MDYPIVFCDYDGTIFDPDAQCVPARTLEAIHAYRKEGGIFVLTTGRIYSSIRPRAHAIGLDDGYLVCLQGSVGYEIDTGRQLFCHDLTVEEWHAVAEFVQARGWYFQIYHDTRFFVGRMNEYTREYADYCEVEPVEVGQPLGTWHEARDWTAHKMIVMTPPEEAAERIATLKKAFPTLDISQSAPKYIEIVNAGSGKGNGIKAVCGLLGIDVAQSVAFGDATNDNSMIIAAGVGVAMGNALADTKAVADLVCAPVSQSGVADVLDMIRAGKPLR